MWLLTASLLVSCLAAGAHSLCWELGHSPFTGAPKTRRVEALSVLVDWGDGVFAEAGECWDVDFMVKFNPKSQPDKYKLSEFTQPGQRKAVIKIDTDDDYMFQVIAREDKGAEHGIDYKYSAIVTSFASDITTQGMAAEAVSSPQPRPGPTPRPTPTTTWKPRPTTTRRPRPITTRMPPPTSPPAPPASYRRPQVKTLNYGNRSLRPDRRQELTRPNYQDPTSSNFGTTSRQRKTPSSTSSSSNSGSQCLPFLKDTVGHGSKMTQDRLIISYIKHMNKKPAVQVEEFLQTRKSCMDGNKKGYVTHCGGEKSCCPVPWISNDECRASCSSSFSVCDGRCIPREWTSDGWPDCMDGSDEPGELGKANMPRKFQCITCSSVVLTAAHLCATSGRGMSADCVNTMIGEGDCNGCIENFFPDLQN